MNIYTIGFSGKSAEQFFDILRTNNIQHLIDVRLWNRSQLAGFTKQNDLQFFLESILNASYTHLPILAPTKPLLDDYKNKQITWHQYETIYLKNLTERSPETKIDPTIFDQSCLLCSEPTAEQCHRRLAAEYLQVKWGDLHIQHL